ncbi:MAG: flagellar hook-length control protein FliK [Salinarimonas sp.]
MIPADLSALAQPRAGERAAGKGRFEGKDGGGSGLGAVFGAALEDVGGREREGGRGAAGGAAAQDGAAQGSSSAKAGAAAEGRLASLVLAGKASLPIRPGALALQARGEGPTPSGEPDPSAEADGEPLPRDGEGLGAPRDTASLLAALAGMPGAASGRSSPAASLGSGEGAVRRAAELATARTQAQSQATGADGPGPDAADAPVSRARALFPDSPDLSLATKPEPSVGMALKAIVVSQATHLPPALGTANLAAIVDGAATLLGAGGASGRGEGAGRASLAFPPDLAAAGAQAGLSARPVKVLTVQLQPVSLGTVTIALRLTADGVAMEITAADAKAAAMLRRDEKLIVDAVRRTGLAGEVVAIHTADAPRASAQSQAQGQAGGDPAAQQHGHGAGDGQTRGQAHGQAHGQARGEGGRGGPESFTLERRPDDDNTPSAPGPRRGGDADGGVYL